MPNKSRREFLLSSGVALSGLAAVQQILAQPNSFSVAASTGYASSQPDNETPRAATAKKKLRGLMVDAARLPESIAYYRRVIDFCAEWELNALHFRIADDQGSALRFASVANLVTHNEALTPQQLHDLAEYAQHHGVDLIPELESFGHTGYITQSPQYAHLLDDDGHNSEDFDGVIPVHPETLELFAKLYREISGIFTSTYLHGGCDEVNWGGSALSRRALQTKTRSQIWTEYLNSLNKIAENLNKQFIVWGDVVLHHQPEILAQLNKNIIIMDWNYVATDPSEVRSALQKIQANGSRAIGAPALTNYRWQARVGNQQLRNIDAFADSYFEPDHAASLGVIATNWDPPRYLQNSIWDEFAYAAISLNNGSASARSSAFRRFVEQHYKTNWSDTWSEAFQILYETAPMQRESAAPLSSSFPLIIPWSSDELLAKALRSPLIETAPLPRLRTLLLQLERRVMKNLADFQSLQLCAEYLDRTFWRSNLVIDHLRKPLDQDTTSLLIRAIAARDRELLDALNKDWANGRSPLSIAKRQLLTALRPKDQLLFQWGEATIYSSSLERDPDRFHKILSAAKSA
jgi:hypothetical protein